MFVSIITLPAQKTAFNELNRIRKILVEDVFQVLKKQEGWIKTVVISNKETMMFKVITYWTSKEKADVIDERDPGLSGLAYMQIGKFAGYFSDENFVVEYFDHLETIEIATD